jgi:hypothetical protein
MTKDDVIRMAREAGLAPIYEACDEPDVRYAYESWDSELERFAALVAAAERERLAKALDHQCRGMSDYFEVKWIRELATALRRNQ